MSLAIPSTYLSRPVRYQLLRRIGEGGMMSTPTYMPDARFACLCAACCMRCCSRSIVVCGVSRARATSQAGKNGGRGKFECIKFLAERKSIDSYAGSETERSFRRLCSSVFTVSFVWTSTSLEREAHPTTDEFGACDVCEGEGSYARHHRTFYLNSSPRLRASEPVGGEAGWWLFSSPSDPQSVPSRRRSRVQPLPRPLF